MTFHYRKTKYCVLCIVFHVLSVYDVSEDITTMKVASESSVRHLSWCLQWYTSTSGPECTKL